MRPCTLLRATLLCGALAAPPAALAADAPAGGAEDLLRRVDKQGAAFHDAIFDFRMRIKEPGGEAREVEFCTIQKGTEKRLVRFLAPGDIKGMGFLSESPEVMYALLPAFGNRVRRLGTHQRNQSFMGSDLNPDDMSVISFAPAYAAKAGGTEGGQTILDLSLRPGQQSDYVRLKMWVDPQKLVINRIEYYDAQGKNVRTQLRSDFQQVPNSSVYFPGKLTFIDHRRNNHQTELALQANRVNSGLPDQVFSVRNLESKDDPQAVLDVCRAHK